MHSDILKKKLMRLTKLIFKPSVWKTQFYGMANYDKVLQSLLNPTPVIFKLSCTLESLGELKQFFKNSNNLDLYPRKCSFIRSGKDPSKLRFY